MYKFIKINDLARWNQLVSENINNSRDDIKQSHNEHLKMKNHNLEDEVRKIVIEHGFDSRRDIYKLGEYVRSLGGYIYKNGSDTYVKDEIMSALSILGSYSITEIFYVILQKDQNKITLDGLMNGKYCSSQFIRTKKSNRKFFYYDREGLNLLRDIIEKDTSSRRMGNIKNRANNFKKFNNGDLVKITGGIAVVVGDNNHLVTTFSDMFFTQGALELVKKMYANVVGESNQLYQLLSNDEAIKEITENDTSNKYNRKNFLTAFDLPDENADPNSLVNQTYYNIPTVNIIVDYIKNSNGSYITPTKRYNGSEVANIFENSQCSNFTKLEDLYRYLNDYYKQFENEYEDMLSGNLNNVDLDAQKIELKKELEALIDNYLITAGIADFATKGGRLTLKNENKRIFKFALPEALTSNLIKLSQNYRSMIEILYKLIK